MNATDLPDQITRAIGGVFAAYGVIGILSGRMERWMAYGFLAVSNFFFGLEQTATGAFQWAALSAGLTAFDAFLWWRGGGEQQLVQLRDRRGRRGGK